jgi:hypothetical protein
MRASDTPYQKEREIADRLRLVHEVFLPQRKTSCLFKKLRLIGMDEAERHGQRYPGEIAEVRRPNIGRQETKH